MKRDIDLKTENVKKMGKQVSTTLKGLKIIIKLIILLNICLLNC